ncbi:ANTAR domain-containing protein [Streptomyces sp. NPDC047829]|uniref:ANTAR domain-containing protein n=1 Tax=Streptomyces sp. NPDC047829 TaxID=3154609 RepID=UPI0033CC2ADD
MPTSSPLPEQTPAAPEDRNEGKVQDLERENGQLRQAVDSHATIDQAIGVLIAVHRLQPAEGFDVLRDISQQSNTKLHTVADAIIGWALGTPMPDAVREGLDRALAQRREL